jgi:magnesium-transporting ATPase (P-type)
MLITSISAIIITAVYTTLRCMDNFSNIQWLGNTVYISGVVMSFIPLTLPYQVFFILCIFMFITYKKGIIFKHLFSIEKFKDINCLCIDNNAVVINDASKV